MVSHLSLLFNLSRSLARSLRSKFKWLTNSVSGFWVFELRSIVSMGRAPCCEKVGLKRGRWTAEEDAVLTKYIQANGEGSWRSLPKNAGLLRCGKSCRLRWINYLRADLKRGNINPDEEQTIIKLHSTLGNKWSLIAAQLPGRTDNEIKNYWNSHLSRKIYFRGSANHSTSSDHNHLDGHPVKLAGSVGNKPRKGRTSRVNSKQHKLSLASLGKPITSKMVLDQQITLQENSSSSSIGQVSSTASEEFCCGGGDLAVGFSPSKDTESEDLGPYEWLDGEIMRLNKSLNVVNTSGLEQEQTKNGQDIVAVISDEKESSFSGLNSTDDELLLYACGSSTMNLWSGFDEEWLDFDWAADGVECHNQCGLWDEADKLLCWLWESDNGEGCQ